MDDRLRRTIGIVFGCALLSGVSIIPIMTTKIPPLGDLVFHMARMKILENPGAPYISEWFRLSWIPIPNLAMDLLVPNLARFVGLEAACRLFVATSMFLIFTGAIALHHSLHRELSWLPLAVSLLVYNFILFFGFVNYLFGVGLLMWALATWFWLGNRSLLLRMLAGAFAALALYFAHLMSVALFAAVVATSELGSLIDRKTLRAHDLGRSIALTTLPFVPVALLFLGSRTTHVASASSDYGVLYSLRQKALSIPALFLTNNLPIDLFIGVGLAVLTVSLLVRRAVQVARPLQLPMFALFALIFVLPTSIGGLSYIDLRLPVAAVFILVATLRFQDRISQRFRVGIGVCVALLTAVRMTAVFIDFGIAHRETTTIAHQFEKLAPGSVIFEGSLDPKPVMWAWDVRDNWRLPWERRHTMPLRHLTTTAILYQPVFVPETLLIDGQEPVSIVPEFHELKALQDPTGNNARWLADDAALLSWIREIKSVVSHPRYRFSSIYIALIDPNDRATPPQDVVTVFSDYHYQIWDISDYIAK